MRIVVVHGPPCSGKTTYVQENIKSEDIVFDYDRILRAISAKQNHSTEKNPAHKIVMAFRYQMIRKASELPGIGTAFLIAHKVDHSLKDFLNSVGCEIDYKFMDTPKEECVKRLAGDKSRPDKQEWEKNHQ